MYNHPDSRLSVRHLVNESHLNTSQEAAAAAEGPCDVTELQNSTELFHELIYQILAHRSENRTRVPRAALVVFLTLGLSRLGFRETTAAY